MNWLDRSIHWSRTGDANVPYAATVDDHALKLRLGDFPAEPLYSLFVDGVAVLSRDSKWPRGWQRPVAPDEESS